LQLLQALILILFELIQPRILQRRRRLIGEHLQPIGILGPEETRRGAFQIDKA